jgi:hypothetical protein
MFVKIDLPPGILRNGTAYGASGRWFDGNLIRFFEGQKRPIGGWRLKTSSTVTGTPRAVITWRENAGSSWAAIGTHTKLFVMTKAGALSDITPVGFVAGRQSASAGTGYGIGPYGDGTYGTARADSTTILDATVWSLDTWGENLTGVSPDDQILYQWNLDPLVKASPVVNAPTCVATVVTAERIQMALGADGDPRMVAWSGQEDNTDWTATDTNQAGSFPLQTSGRLMCGRKVAAGTLLFTDQDVWLAGYVGFPLVYGFQKVGNDCGPISRGSVVTTENHAVWMGHNGFYTFSGEVQPIACDVADLVFTQLNTNQESKVTAWHNAAFGEVWWFYPDKNHLENSSYVIYNYREGHWSIGDVGRSCAVAQGAFAYPILCNYTGAIYEHEVGSEWDGEVPFLTSAPVEIGNGDQTVTVKRIVPDERTSGDVTVSFRTRYYPNADRTDYGPYDLSSPTDCLFTARQVQLTLTSASNDDWRVGTFRLDVAQRGKR